MWVNPLRLIVSLWIEHIHVLDKVHVAYPSSLMGLRRKRIGNRTWRSETLAAVEAYSSSTATHAPHKRSNFRSHFASRSAVGICTGTEFSMFELATSCSGDATSQNMAVLPVTIVFREALGSQFDDAGLVGIVREPAVIWGDLNSNARRRSTDANRAAILVDRSRELLSESVSTYRKDSVSPLPLTNPPIPSHQSVPQYWRNLASEGGWVLSLQNLKTSADHRVYFQYCYNTMLAGFVSSPDAHGGSVVYFDPTNVVCLVK